MKRCVRCKEPFVGIIVGEVAIGVFSGFESDPIKPIAYVTGLCEECTQGIVEVVSGKRKWGEKNFDAT